MQLQIINQQEVLEKQFTVYGDLNNPLFLAKDVAEWIDYAYKDAKKTNRDISKMLQTVDVDEKQKHTVNLGREQYSHGGIRENTEMWFLTEDGIYEVLMQSRKPIAKQFKRRVKDILKGLRTGTMHMLPQTHIEALEQLIHQIKLNESLALTNNVQNQVIGELQPKADYLDGILKSKSLMPITSIAKDYGMSGQRMNKILQDKKVQYKMSDQWILYSKYHDKAYTSSKTLVVVDSHGHEKVVLQTCWTQKGRLFLYNLLKKDGILPMIERVDEE